MTPEEKKQLVDSVPMWWHTIDFGDGVRSKGHTPARVELIRESMIPNDLTGYKVLDVGCGDGYYSFLCEQRGAKVTAIDTGAHSTFVMAKWGIDLRENSAFYTAKKLLGSKVVFHDMDVMDAEELKTKFDLVLFMGVFYHLRSPVKALSLMGNITKGSIIVESHYIPGDGEPHLIFYPRSELNADPTCWWGPNLAFLKKTLNACGFSIDQLKEYENQHGEPRVLIKASVS